MGIENRYLCRELAGVECRADEDKPAIISGYGAVFYDGTEATEYELWSDAVERIDPSAFDEALTRDDVRGLFNHDPSCLLGRNVSGTMRLKVDSKGLHYEIDTPETGVGRDTVTSIKRGDLTGSSFSFRATRVEWSEEGDKEIRLIKEVELFDVGPVTFPAYTGSTADSRSLDSLRQERDQEKQDSESESSAELDLVTASCRLAEIGLND